MDEERDAFLDQAATELRAALPEVSASLDERVMAVVRARPAPAAVGRPSPVRWLWEPRRIRPVWIPALAAAAALLVWVLGPRRAAVAPVPAPVLARGADTVFVRFELAAPDARVVAVAGSFNGWNAQALPMVRSAAGTWSVTVPLPVGEHLYQFVVDGERWQPDPGAHAQVEDGFGGVNSVIVVGPRGLVRT
jgi:hypothetical protein